MRDIVRAVGIMLAFGLGLAALVYLAPVITLACLVLLLVAWRRPEALRRLTEHPRAARLPASVRGSPRRFAIVASAALLPLSILLIGLQPGGGERPRPTPTPPRVAAAPTRTPTAPPTALATPAAPSPTPAATLTATAAPTPTTAPSPTPVPPTPTPTPSGPPLAEAHVVRVVDGDTLEVRIGGQVATVRIIGVDTPETVDPRQPVMCYGPEASAYTRQLVDQAAGRILLEKDVSETDRYGRLLRYVWLEHPDGRRMLNYELVAQGYAQVSTYPPDVRYQELFLQAQREAQAAGRGLWGACGGFGVPAVTPTPVPVPTPTAAPPSRGNCSPAYPDVCIPPPPPDLDCGDIPYRRFTVLPPDPHGFDRDGDGVGCESG
ncbi:MAG TPA: thermonuclease family protein [Gemmatimonadaceae bacterium]